MVHSNPAQVYFRSISARGNHGGIPNGLEAMIQALSESGWDRVIIETVGWGQGEFAVISVADRILLVDGRIVVMFCKQKKRGYWRLLT